MVFLQVPADKIDPPTVPGYLFQGCDSRFVGFVYFVCFVYLAGLGFFNGLS